MPNLKTLGLLTTLGLAAGTTGHAATSNFRAILNDISGLNGSGTANLQYDDVAQTLKVKIMGKGFAPNMLHVQHIHGAIAADGSAIKAVSPTLANDTDGDGIVELLEGVPLYGGILLSLFDETDTGNGFNGFPNVTATDGSFSFSAVYDLLNTTALNTGVTAANLFPLDKREIVIHGAFLSPNIGGVGNETAGDQGVFDFGGYSNFVPVAAGEISAVPVPAAAWLLLTGFGGLGALRRFGRKAKA